MATVSANTAANTAQSSSAASKQTLLGSYDLFLTLLTTQIQNQDPLEPLDASQYTQQLVQYSSVEQAIKSNEYLENLIAMMQAGQASSYVNYLGSQVTASGASTVLENGEATWKANVSEAATGLVEIRNSAGAKVYEGKVDFSRGDNTFVWDGKSSNGIAVPDGAYSISFQLSNAAGNKVTPVTQISGKVDRVDLSSGTPYLEIGGVSIPVSSVTSVSRAS
ncbi:flagellar hook assembly protein FlgD [Pannonibacter phragmitetus]|uniref:flagellar hook assembly protein FlgD n=1 Tax=Pannonibacter phragmitetus TaxID=121719 RepID=UPI003D2EFF19